MGAGRRRREAVRGESIGRAASLQEHLVGPGKAGRRHRRRSCGGDHPGTAGDRATARGFRHLGDRPVALRRRLGLRRGAAGTVAEPGLVVGGWVGGFIARLVAWPSVERDVSEEQQSGLSPAGILGLPSAFSLRFCGLVVPAGNRKPAQRGRHSSLNSGGASHDNNTSVAPPPSR